MPSYHNLCKNILNLDKSIRLAILFSKDGDIVGVEVRNPKQLLIPPQDICTWIVKSLLQTNIVQTLEQNLGKVIYTFTEFEKVKTIMIGLEGCAHDVSLHDCVILVTFDRDSDHQQIVDEKLFPLLKKYRFDDNNISSELST